MISACRIGSGFSETDATGSAFTGMLSTCPAGSGFAATAFLGRPRRAAGFGSGCAAAGSAGAGAAGAETVFFSSACSIACCFSRIISTICAFLVPRGIFT